MHKEKILVVLGTRPEAIKMAPVVLALQAIQGLQVQVCVTGQHREMLDQVLNLFSLKPHYDLNIMRADQSLADITANCLLGLRSVLEKEKPTVVLVHGDTTTALAATLAAYYEKLPVGHVEAGLRTHDIYAPWPEEINRQLVTRIADIHFAPTGKARQNLIDEGVGEECIHVVGNTVIDALLEVASQVRQDPVVQEAFGYLDLDRKTILVTAHRRENFGEGFSRVCRALLALSEREDVQIVYPVHPNPKVQKPVRELLSGRKNIHLIEPLDYRFFVALMDRATLILTDSGGIQEEAPSLGKPVLVMRASTERPEALEAGTVRLVGTDDHKIIEEVSRLLDSESAYAEMAHAHNPYGDGRAAERIAKIMSGNLVGSN